MAPSHMMQKLSLVCLISTTVPSASALGVAITAAQALGVLQQRDSTCANSSSTSCAAIDSRLPGDICCGAGSTCISLDSGSTALCCPSGQNCTQIQPLSCTLSQQDPKVHPDAAVQTTRLGGSLPTCGNACCPFGYECQSGTCAIITDTSSLSPSFHNNGTAPPASSTSTTTSSASSTATKPAGIDSTKPQLTSTCSKFPAAAVVAGFFPGMIAGVLFAILGILLCGRSRKYDSRPSSEGCSNYKTHTRGRSDDTKYAISDPIPLDTQSARTDFLMRTTTRAKSFLRKSPKLGGNSYQENSWKMPTPPVPNNVPAEPGSGLVPVFPVTPERQIRDESGITHQPSTESIRVYSPQNIARPPTNPVAPVRGMAAQRDAATNFAAETPFKTPEKRDNTYHDVAPTAPYETLTPARYGDASSLQSRREKGSDMSRPTTTFTEMLHEIDFPDPMGKPPAMPPIPKALNVNGKGRERARR